MITGRTGVGDGIRAEFRHFWRWRLTGHGRRSPVVVSSSRIWCGHGRFLSCWPRKFRSNHPDTMQECFIISPGDTNVSGTKFPSSSRTSACIARLGPPVGVGEPYSRVAAGDEPYSFTITVRSASALSRASLSVHSWRYSRYIWAVSWDTAATAPFSVFTIMATSQSGTSKTLPGDNGVTIISRFLEGNSISWSASSSSSGSESGFGHLTGFE